MNSWPKIKLGDLCDIVAGSTPDSKNSQYWNGDINWVTPAEMKGDSIFIEATERKITQAGFDSCSTKRFPKGAVILSTRAPIGKVAIAATEMCSNQGIKSLTPKPEKLDSFYLYWWLKDHADYLNSLGSGATFKELSMTVLKSIQIPVPPIDVQKRIVTTLNACHDLKKKREGADNKMTTFASALFYQMFGDPTKNERAWEVKKLGTLCDVFADGDWIESKDQSNDGIRLLQTGNVGLGVFRDKGDRSRYISEETFKRLRCTEIFPNDILISRLPDPVGRACIIPSIKKRLITAVDCTIVRLNSVMILPEFFLTYTLTRAYQNQINRQLTGTTRKRISRSNLALIEVPVPPIEMQKKFAEHMSKAQEVQNKQLLEQKMLEQIFEGVIAQLI